jgi:serine-type D-Ala-D-Ala carboxypeptidase/endopeptidase (penicillin-binding protein 4)
MFLMSLALTRATALLGRLVMAVTACASLLLPLAIAAPSDELPLSVAQVLKRHGLSRSGFSIYAHVLGEPQPLLAHEADTPRSPASVLKLLPSAAALEDLGPAYQWSTEAYASVPVKSGRLDGDLYLKGYGDPYLVIENFWRLLRALRLAGLDAITGDLVIDQSYFTEVAGDSADFDGQGMRAYNVLPRALLVNFQAVQLRLLPQPPRLRVISDPPMALENRIKLLDGACRSSARSWQLRTRRQGAKPKLVLEGSYSAACGEDEMFRVVSESGPYIHGVFQSLWLEQGGQFSGGWREAPTPGNAMLLQTFQSPPLSEVVRAINKYSNNVMTRQLLLTFGAERFGPPGTVEKGARAVQDWLARRGLKFPELVLENGSGLSRSERISARSLGRLLQAVYAGPYMAEFISALPISATDGTLAERFRGQLAGRMHLKTGSIDGVRSLAGYVLDAAGRRVVVVYLHNDPRANSAAGQAVQQALLSWIHGRPGVGQSAETQ